MQQQQQGHGAIFSSLLGAQEEPWGNVESILQTLEDQQSLLTGMFRDFVREVQGVGLSGVPAAAPSPAGSNQAGVASACTQKHPQMQQPRGHAVKRSRPPTELPLNVTLEELYNGTLKKVPVQLRRQDAHTGAPVTVVQQLQVCVQPGLHAGTRITLPG